MKVKEGHTVSVIYDGFLENGEVFESSEVSGPMEFQVGEGLIMPEFEQNVIDMQANETKTFTIPASQAHGLSQPELVHTMRRSSLPNHEELKLGMVLGLNVEREGKQHKVPATIKALDEETVTVDFNHPLAGHDLTYKITLKDIQQGPSTQSTD